MLFATQIESNLFFVNVICLILGDDDKVSIESIEAEYGNLFAELATNGVSVGIEIDLSKGLVDEKGGYN